MLVPVCEEMKRYNVALAAGASATLSFYLFNKETGELWWKGSSSQSVMQPGLIGGLADSINDYENLAQCLDLDVLLSMKSLPRFVTPSRRIVVNGANDMQRIAVTAVVDGRRRVSKSVVYAPAEIQTRILEILQKKGYEGIPVVGYGQRSLINKTQVALADSAFVKSLGGVGVKYVLIPVVNDISTYSELGGKHYDLSFYLFNTESGELVWNGSSYGTSLKASLTALSKDAYFPRRKDLSK